MLLPSAEALKTHRPLYISLHKYKYTYKKKIILPCVGVISVRLLATTCSTERDGGSLLEVRSRV